MNIKIGIIENEKEHIDSLRKALLQWEHKYSTNLNISVLKTDLDLLSQTPLNYHLIFLDIQLDTVTGIEIAQILRKEGFHGEIVFLTAYREYVFEGYNVRALNYYLKPVSYDDVESCLNYIRDKLWDSSYIYRHQSTIINILYQDILFFSSCNQYIEIHTSNKTYKQATSLKTLITYLPAQFIRCHRTAIVNIYHVEKLEKKDIYLSDGTILPISNTYLTEIREVFLRHLRK